MPKVEVSPASASVAPGKAARFQVVFLDNGGNRIGPDDPSQVVPKVVAGKGQLGAVVMRKEGAVFTFRPYCMYSVLEISGPGVMDSPRVEVRGESPIPVMPNSAFESVSMAVLAESAPSDFEPPPFAPARMEVDLCGTWKYQAESEADKIKTADWQARPDTDDSAWGTMKVPSNFVLEDPSLADFYGPVWFRRRFKVDGKTRSAHKRFVLRFEAADYFAAAWLNGKPLGSHEGYFAPFEFDITPHLADGENLLAVRIVNPYDEGMRSAEQQARVSFCEKVWIKGILNYHDTRPGSIELSADESQTMGTGGIVRPVKVVAHGPVTIDWVRIDTVLPEDNPCPQAAVRARHYIFNHTADFFQAGLAFQVSGVGFEQAARSVRTVSLPPGPSFVDMELKVDNPRLWWPWSHPELGMPSLYTGRSSLFIAAGKARKGQNPLVDSAETGFGIRSVRMSETGDRPWQWTVNGRRMFFRGTNMIPTIYMSRSDEALARRDFDLARKAHLDGVIVLDHHQPPVFYGVADREGMPIFQEFTLVWEYSIASHERDNGDPALLSNAEVAKRMLVEAMMLYHNHPSIFWWSLHDEPFFTFGNFDAGESEIPQKAFGPGERMPLLMDRTFNRALDAELAKAAAACDPARPWHVSGNEGNNSTDYFGWYHGIHTDTREHRQVAPIEFGAQAVPYSAEEFMLRRYGKGIWPPVDEAMYRKWMFHDLQYGLLSAHIGATGRYTEFHDWAFASQLHQAAVVKYNIERFRTNRYSPTGCEFYFMFSSWWPSITWGTLDHAREPMTAYRWLCECNTPVAAIADPGSGLLPGGRAEIPLIVVNDLHAPLNGVLKWAVVETAGSFVLRTDPGGAMEGFRNQNWSSEFPDAVSVLDRCGAALGKIAGGELTFAIGGDLMSLPKPAVFDLPRFEEKPRHYSLELSLEDREGRVVARNRYQFCVAGPDPKAFFRPGLSPLPRFSVTFTPGRAAGPQKYNLERKHSVKQVACGVMFEGDPRTCKELPPGIYVLNFTSKGKALRKEILVDCDLSVPLD